MKRFLIVAVMITAPAFAAGGEDYQPQIVYAHDIHSDVVWANVIQAHDVQAADVRVRVIYRAEGEPGGPKGQDINAPIVTASQIQAHDIHTRVIEADKLYVHDIHTDR